MAKVINRRALKDRLSVFLQRAKNYDLGITEVLNCMQSLGETAIFGGMLRDLLLYGERGFKSDVDLVVAGDQEALGGALRIFSTERTSFGGYRLNYKHSKIDIWCLQETWAIKEGLIAGRSFQDLVKTTFFNWDAVAYLVNERKFIFGENYIDSVANRYLDINLEQNPNPRGVLRRTFERVSRDNAILAPRLVGYVSRIIDSQDAGNLVSGGIDCNDNFLYFCSTLRRHFEESPKSPYVLNPQLPLWETQEHAI